MEDATEMGFLAVVVKQTAAGDICLLVQQGPQYNSAAMRI